MTDSATERARALLANVLGYGDDYASFFRASIDTLMENPNLLVDLALEAGGLEQCATVKLWEEEDWTWPGVLWDVNTTTDSLVTGEPVYRRKETE